MKFTTGVFQGIRSLQRGYFKGYEVYNGGISKDKNFTKESTFGSKETKVKYYLET